MRPIHSALLPGRKHLRREQRMNTRIRATVGTLLCPKCPAVCIAAQRDRLRSKHARDERVQGAGSPFFRTLPLARYGLEWVYPPAALAHLLDDGAAILERSIGLMGATLGKQDAEAWRNLFTQFVEHWDALAQGILGPLRPGFQIADPLISLEMARFGLSAFQPARGLAE